MSTVLITGASGFLGGYIVPELLSRGHTVIGLDNYSKYGRVRRGHDDDPNYRLVEGDAADAALVRELLEGCDHFIAGAAMIGGIPYLHTFPYDLFATNERITIAACDAAIDAYRDSSLRKITVISSSLVFERTDHWPSVEGDELQIPPPLTSYGFQKLGVEVFAKAAHEQYGLPYTIVRPFNCVGMGELRAQHETEVESGTISLAMSHVVPDLVKKVLMGQDPLHLLGDGAQQRPFTYAGDFARGTVTAMEHPAALNEDFNISTPTVSTVLELAAAVWRRVHGDEPLRVESDESMRYDVQKRIPSVDKARDLLGFEATTSLEEMLDEVIPWIQDALDRGLL